MDRTYQKALNGLSETCELYIEEQKAPTAIKEGAKKLLKKDIGLIQKLIDNQQQVPNVNGLIEEIKCVMNDEEAYLDAEELGIIVIDRLKQLQQPTNTLELEEENRILKELAKDLFLELKKKNVNLKSYPDVLRALGVTVQDDEGMFLSVLQQPTRTLEELGWENYCENGYLKEYYLGETVTVDITSKGAEIGVDTEDYTFSKEELQVIINMMPNEVDNDG